MVKLKWLGHAAWLLTFEKKTALIDPFLTDNPNAAVKAENIRKVDYIFITHEHFDHVGDTFSIARRTGAAVVSLFEFSQKAVQEGIPQEKAIGMNKGSSPVDIGGLKVAFTDAVHSGNESGVIIRGDGKTIYHAGDTALFSDMSLIRELYHPNIALLPIGGYFTMGPREAAIAGDMIGADISIPMHYDTFPPIKQNPGDFVDALNNSKGKVLKPGEEMSL